MRKKIGYIDYNKNLKQFSRNHRNQSTLGEILLWMQLRSGQMLGHKFNRQKPLSNYIVDFYCKKLNLVIEVDGYSHQFKTKEDEEREKHLKEMGLYILRFTEQDCRKNMLNVARAIESWIEEQPLPLLNEQNTNPPASLYFLQGGENSQ